MKAIFEEYGTVILAVITGVLLFGLIFGGIHLYQVMGAGMDVDSSFHHSDSEEAVKQAAERAAPEISVVDSTKLHLYTNQVFKPIASVSCVDNEGTVLAATVTSIVFIDAGGNQTEYLNRYNATADEFDIPSVVNEPGVLAVTYKAVDSYNVLSIKTISFVVDAVNS